MDVLFVASWYPSWLSPKNGNFVEQHARAVQSAGCDVRVAHLLYSNRILIPEIRLIQQNNIAVYHVLIPRLLKNSDRIHAFIFKRLILKFAEVNFNPQIIHGHVVYAGGKLAVFLKEFYEAPLVYTEHWSGYKPVNTQLYTAEVSSLTSSVIGHTDLILPVSEDLAENMLAKGLNGTYSVVNNTVDTSVFYTTSNINPHKIFQFLHISNFEPRSKNTEGIIRAFAHGNFKDSCLTIAGDGDIEKLRVFADALDADTSRIEFVGALTYTEVADLMRDSDCFVLFSNFENLPCVIAESHCCGLPVIATNVGGIAEMIDSENGLLISAGDEKALIAAMHKMIETKNSFNPSVIAGRASKRYSLTTIGHQFLEHYRNLLNKSKN